MAVEIERKFLVKVLPEHLPEGLVIKQGYIHSDVNKTVRVRRKGNAGFLTIKGATQGVSRAEFEYPIPVSDVEEMLSSLCTGQLIDKTRYCIEHDGLIWELDVFTGANAGLIVVEVELEDELQSFSKPDWVGEEVSHDKRYFNACLVDLPFSCW